MGMTRRWARPTSFRRCSTTRTRRCCPRRPVLRRCLHFQNQSRCHFLTRMHHCLHCPIPTRRRCSRFRTRIRFHFPTRIHRCYCRLTPNRCHCLRFPNSCRRCRLPWWHPSQRRCRGLRRRCPMPIHRRRTRGAPWRARDRCRCGSDVAPSLDPNTSIGSVSLAGVAKTWPFRSLETAPRDPSRFGSSRLSCPPGHPATVSHAPARARHDSHVRIGAPQKGRDARPDSNRASRSADRLAGARLARRRSARGAAL